MQTLPKITKSSLVIGALPSEKFTVETQRLCKKQLSALKKAGHTVVNIDISDDLATLFFDEYYILLYDFNKEINQYLANTPDQVEDKKFKCID